MNVSAKSTAIAVALILCTGMSFAAETTVPAMDSNGARSVGSRVKVDAKTDAAAVKLDARGKTSESNAAAREKLVDINTASVNALKAIPGIGAAYAEKIVAGRPYANKAQLKSRKILPVTVYEQVKELIIAKAIKK